MADKKISTIILEVDLDCSCCVKKITKTLNKYPEIQTKVFNHEKKTVTISGPFNPEKLMKCICCKAGKYIKSYEIVVDKPKPKPETKPDPPKKPDPSKKPDPIPEPVKKPDPKLDPPSKPKEVDPPKPPEQAKKPDPPKPKPEPPKPELPVLPVIPVMPVQPYPVSVNCGQCFYLHPPGPCPQIWGGPYEGYWAGPYSSPYAPPGPSACRFFSEEESTCRTM